MISLITSSTTDPRCFTWWFY